MTWPRGRGACSASTSQHTYDHHHPLASVGVRLNDHTCDYPTYIEQDSFLNLLELGTRSKIFRITTMQVGYDSHAFGILVMVNEPSSTYQQAVYVYHQRFSLPRAFRHC